MSVHIVHTHNKIQRTLETLYLDRVLKFFTKSRCDVSLFWFLRIVQRNSYAPFLAGHQDMEVTDTMRTWVNPLDFIFSGVCVFYCCIFVF